jgi:excisionase family DNA binding protein
MPVIPNQGGSMATPHLLRTLTLNRVRPSGRLGASRPVAGGLAHLRVMETNNANAALGDAPKPQVLSVVEAVLSLSELCSKLQVSAQTIYDLRSQGRGPRGFRVGRELRFRVSEIDAWLSRLESEDDRRHHLRAR